MFCYGKTIFGILIMVTVGIFVAQIIFGVHYLHKPVKCERSEFLTILTLAGGCSGILSIVLLSCCCYRRGYGLKSSDPDHNERQLLVVKDG